VIAPSDGPRAQPERSQAQSAQPLALRLSLQREPHAPSLARAAVRRFGEASEIAASETATLALLVSELVSNAVLHTDAPPASGILLCARLLDGHAVRVEVIDRGSGFTAIPRDPTRVHGGYGLYLVDTQSTRWGVDCGVDRDGGTRVWFELGGAGGRAPGGGAPAEGAPA
jgi:anti-sigma regulatory factor (Ser/Thr protein kinase)